MYVLPVAEVLALEKALPAHEDIHDKLVEWHEGMGPVAFISQTWLTGGFPDDAHGSKLTLLKALLRRAAAGELEVFPHGGAVHTYGASALKVDAAQLKVLAFAALCGSTYSRCHKEMARCRRRRSRRSART